MLISLFLRPRRHQEPDLTKTALCRKMLSGNFVSSKQNKLEGFRVCGLGVVAAFGALGALGALALAGFKVWGVQHFAVGEVRV